MTRRAPQETKVLFLNRAPPTLDFRPYDLVVVQVMLPPDLVVLQVRKGGGVQVRRGGGSR